jgi:uncharacterized protein YutE (UPF0331/DUF86 family)
MSIDRAVLAERAAAVDRHLTRVAGFRNVIAHAYESLDMRRVHRAAAEGPADLRRFLARIADLTR